MSNPTPKQTTVTDTAALIVAFFEAWSDRYSELRDDPVLAPILSRATERYQAAKRGSDFTTAAQDRDDGGSAGDTGPVSAVTLLALAALGAACVAWAPFGPWEMT